MRLTPATREQAIRRQRAPWEPRVSYGIGSADGESQYVDFRRLGAPVVSVASPTNTFAANRRYGGGGARRRRRLGSTRTLPGGARTSFTLGNPERHHEPSRKDQFTFSRYPQKLISCTVNGAFSLQLNFAERRTRLSARVNLTSEIGRFGPTVRVGVWGYNPVCKVTPLILHGVWGCNPV